MSDLALDNQGEPVDQAGNALLIDAAQVIQGACGSLEPAGQQFQLFRGEPVDEGTQVEGIIGLFKQREGHL